MYRIGRRFPPWSLATLGVLALAMPVAGRVPALVALGLLPVVCIVLLLVGLRRDVPTRARVRETALGEQRASEEEQTEWRRRHL